MKLTGRDTTDKSKQILFEMAARQGDGLYIPCIPSILVAIKLARGNISETGASPCMGFITLDEYLHALQRFNIRWRVETSA